MTTGLSFARLLCALSRSCASGRVSKKVHRRYFTRQISLFVCTSGDTNGFRLLTGVVSPTQVITERLGLQEIRTFKGSKDTVKTSQNRTGRHSDLLVLRTHLANQSCCWTPPLTPWTLDLTTSSMHV